MKPPRCKGEESGLPAGLVIQRAGQKGMTGKAVICAGRIITAPHFQVINIWPGFLSNFSPPFLLLWRSLGLTSCQLFRDLRFFSSLEQRQAEATVPAYWVTFGASAAPISWDGAGGTVSS